MCFRNNTAAEGSNPSRFRFIDITRSAMKRVAAMFVERVFCEKKEKERKGKERKTRARFFPASAILRLVILSSLPSFLAFFFSFSFFCSIDLRKNGTVYDKETISFDERLGKRRKKMRRQGEGEERTANTKLTAELKE